LKRNAARDEEELTRTVSEQFSFPGAARYQ
jgi:hypothetical protein